MGEIITVFGLYSQISGGGPTRYSGSEPAAVRAFPARWVAHPFRRWLTEAISAEEEVQKAIQRTAVGKSPWIGEPPSDFYKALCSELLAQLILRDQRIQGVQIDNGTIKTMIHADDTCIIMTNHTDLDPRSSGSVDAGPVHPPWDTGRHRHHGAAHPFLEPDDSPDTKQSRLVAKVLLFIKRSCSSSYIDGNVGPPICSEISRHSPGSHQSYGTTIPPFKMARTHTRSSKKSACLPFKNRGGMGCMDIVAGIHTSNVQIARQATSYPNLVWAKMAHRLLLDSSRIPCIKEPVISPWFSAWLHSTTSVSVTLGAVWRTWPKLHLLHQDQNLFRLANLLANIDLESLPFFYCPVVRAKDGTGPLGSTMVSRGAHIGDIWDFKKNRVKASQGTQTS
nr:hypothetical protein CFP56_02536 [Quercus suber]